MWLDWAILILSSLDAVLNSVTGRDEVFRLWYDYIANFKQDFKLHVPVVNLSEEAPIERTHPVSKCIYACWQTANKVWERPVTAVLSGDERTLLAT